VDTFRTAHNLEGTDAVPLYTAPFPDGLVWSHKWGFLNHRDKSLMQDLRAFMEQIASGDMFGVPDGI
jgi:hypothetical protein